MKNLKLGFAACLTAAFLFSGCSKDDNESGDQQRLLLSVERIQKDKDGNIEKEEVDMDAKTLYIRAYIREHQRFSFRQLLEKQHSKTEIIVTFLVMLEEIKLGEIEIEQDSTFGDIMITSRKAS